MVGREEFEFANDVRAALEERAPRTAWLLTLAVALILAGGYAWAQWAVVEEVTSGTGKVIPSTQIQVVQSLERGIVREISVKEGDLVEADQTLMRIDDTGVASQLGELSQRRWTLEAEIARLEAEATSAEAIAEDPELAAKAPDAVRAEAAVFRAHRAKLRDELAVLAEQRIQKAQELLEFQAKAAKLTASLKPLRRELKLTRDMRKRGVVPEVELLRLQRQEAEASGELSVVKAAIPRAEAAVTEVDRRVASAKALLRTVAQERLAKARGELAIVVESIKAARDRVVRTALKAPARGVVNKLNVTTIGAVVQPGQDLIEIVPLDDTLLIEANIRPQDVAFIRPDQTASVKLTAYDYLVYGALEGKVTRIGADTITDEEGETFYRVIVRTEQTHLAKDGETLPIIPGMVAAVDIQTGEKTVLDYLLKPLRKVRQEALRER